MGGARVTYTDRHGIQLTCTYLGNPNVFFDQATWSAPGPDTVVVMPNQSVPDSLILAERYADARDIPANRICPIDVPNVETISLQVFRERVLQPLQACLNIWGASLEIEAVVLMRGVPINVDIPVDGGTMSVSLAAALSVWESVDDMGTPILGQIPGRPSTCGASPCTIGRWQNSFLRGYFFPGWSRETTQGVWRPILVTALNGYTFTDAYSLVESGLTAERDGPQGTFLLMGGDQARDQLDGQLDDVADS